MFLVSALSHIYAFNLRVPDTAVNSRPNQLVVGCLTPSSGRLRPALAACDEDRSRRPA